MLRKGGHGSRTTGGSRIHDHVAQAMICRQRNRLVDRPCTTSGDAGRLAVGAAHDGSSGAGRATDDHVARELPSREAPDDLASARSALVGCVNHHSRFPIINDICGPYQKFRTPWLPPPSNGDLGFRSVADGNPAHALLVVHFRCGTDRPGGHWSGHVRRFVSVCAARRSGSISPRQRAVQGRRRITAFLFLAVLPTLPSLDAVALQSPTDTGDAQLNRRPVRRLRRRSPTTPT